jgi:NitT/TauT family transport system substrate-binding protein
VLRVVEPASVAEPHFQWGLLVARAQFIEEQPDLLRRLLRAYLRGVRHCVENPAQLRALLLRDRHAQDAAVLDRAFTRTLPIWNTSGEIDLPGLTRAIEVMVEIGSLKAPLDGQALVDLRGLPGRSA